MSTDISSTVVTAYSGTCDSLIHRLALRLPLYYPWTSSPFLKDSIFRTLWMSFGRLLSHIFDPINAEDLVRLLKVQIDENLDKNCTPFGICGSYGAPFKLTYTAYNIWLYSRWEGNDCGTLEGSLQRSTNNTVYQILRKAQGSHSTCFSRYNRFGANIFPWRGRLFAYASYGLGRWEYSEYGTDLIASPGDSPVEEGNSRAKSYSRGSSSCKYSLERWNQPSIDHWLPPV